MLAGLADTVCAFAVTVPDLTLPRFTDPDHARGSAWMLLLERLERSSRA